MGRSTIRTATEQDAGELLAIYAPYIQRTAVTFEYAVPPVDAFAERIRGILTKYPYLAAERDGEIIGYAYAGTFHKRAACAWNVETAIYVRMDKRGTGVGRELYEALEQALILQNVLNMNACIAYTETEDEYLTKNSVQFHRHLGFTYVGRFHQCGYKFGRWYDLAWMEKHIGAHTETPASVRNFCEIKDFMDIG